MRQLQPEQTRGHWRVGEESELFGCFARGWANPTNTSAVLALELGHASVVDVADDHLRTLLLEHRRQAPAHGAHARCPPPRRRFSTAPTRRSSSSAARPAGAAYAASRRLPPAGPAAQSEACLALLCRRTPPTSFLDRVGAGRRPVRDRARALLRRLAQPDVPALREHQRPSGAHKARHLPPRAGAGPRPPRAIARGSGLASAPERRRPRSVEAWRGSRQAPRRADGRQGRRGPRGFAAGLLQMGNIGLLNLALMQGSASIVVPAAPLVDARRAPSARGSRPARALRPSGGVGPARAPQSAAAGLAAACAPRLGPLQGRAPPRSSTAARWPTAPLR